MRNKRKRKEKRKNKAKKTHGGQRIEKKTSEKVRDEMKAKY